MKSAIDDFEDSLLIYIDDIHDASGISLLSEMIEEFLVHALAKAKGKDALADAHARLITSVATGEFYSQLSMELLDSIPSGALDARRVALKAVHAYLASYRRNIAGSIPQHEILH